MSAEMLQSSNLPLRHRLGRVWLVIFQVALVVGIIALCALLFNIFDGSFGYVAVQDKVNPATLAVDGVPLEELDKDTLVEILRSHVSAGLMARYEFEKPFAEREAGEVYDLILERVVAPEFVAQWSLYQSLTNADEIRQTVAEQFPEARVEFRSWLNWHFLRAPQSSYPEIAGVRTAVFGSLWTISIAVLFAFPVGVAAAVYLQEYAPDNLINRIIQTNITNLAGVPSIIYGILGLAIFVRALGQFTSGIAFGVSDPATANGRTILSAGLTLGMLVLPLIIINAQEAIKAVPASLRQASYGLGATRWETVWHHVLPNAMAGIMTGTILAISRAIGETAPLIVIGASTFIQVDPEGPFSKFTTLPIQIYQWTARPQSVFRNLAGGASLVLLGLLLSMNATAIILRNRYRRSQ
ncbi:MAG TPA: phosphate ABC transporter permease PstA [Anaerolineales bacterium]|nr:phosphate ABC transporter permease PstA [Anaerolineales bacterium]HRQ93008.1 phosphate ABC transporter permease PstA [Anaerolineales bacterium]